MFLISLSFPLPLPLSSSLLLALLYSLFVVSPLLGSKDRHIGMSAPQSLGLESRFLANTRASGPPLMPGHRPQPGRLQRSLSTGHTARTAPISPPSGLVPFAEE